MIKLRAYSHSGVSFSLSFITKEHSGQRYCIFFSFSLVTRILYLYIGLKQFGNSIYFNYNKNRQEWRLFFCGRSKFRRGWTPTLQSKTRIFFPYIFTAMQRVTVHFYYCYTPLFLLIKFFQAQFNDLKENLMSCAFFIMESA